MTHEMFQRHVEAVSRVVADEHETAESDPPWPERVTRTLAAEIRRYRKLKGWSTQQLADATTELGLPMVRSVLANLETGRRTTISVPEVFALAAALDVPPLLLMFPVGRDVAIEPLPGRTMTPWEAFKIAELGLTDEQGKRDTPSVLGMFRRHDEALTQLELADRRLRGQEERFAKEVAASGGSLNITALTERARNDREYQGRTLIAVRELIRAAGLNPPPLPPELTYIDPSGVSL